jgi:formylglycine-generating enzyme required for sulfatase activity
MHGNVSEWCADWYAADYDYYASFPSSNPKGAKNGGARVLRGGSWSLNARYVRSADRYGITPVLRINALGFRLAHP